MGKFIALTLTHLAVLAFGICLGIYLLPILAAPPAPTAAQVQAASAGARYSASFVRKLKGSDALHWGEGRVSVGPGSVALMGRIAPGPSYRLYLVPGLVETGEEFLRVKSRALLVAEVKTFENFIVPLPPGALLDSHNSVVIWCETFSRFITAGRYR